MPVASAFVPLLVLLASQFGDPHAAGVVPAAVVVELTHLATLYHDDVMDEADAAAGSPVGECALGQHRRDPHRRLPLLQSLRAARRPRPRGGAHPGADLRTPGGRPDQGDPGAIRPTTIPVEHYLAVVADKTGSLIATSGRFGAMMSGSSQEIVEVMTTYGELIGVAFQLADDVLDVSSDSSDSGKTPGTDLREGVRTLPVLHALRSTDPADAELQELLRSDLSDDVRHARRSSCCAPAMRWARAGRPAAALRRRRECSVRSRGPARSRSRRSATR